MVLFAADLIAMSADFDIIIGGSILVCPQKLESSTPAICALGGIWAFCTAAYKVLEPLVGCRFTSLEREH